MRLASAGDVVRCTCIIFKRNGSYAGNSFGTLGERRRWVNFIPRVEACLAEADWGEVCRMKKMEDVAKQLGLEKLDHEGGFFRRIHTGEKGADGKPLSTTIYALFSRQEFSALHRLDVVEQFFFVDGDAFEAFRITADGTARTEFLGIDFEKGESPHLVFEPGCWFGGAPVADGGCGWTLMSCVVTPGFDWKSFEIGDRSQLLESYPECGDAIRRLTRVS